VAGRAAPERQCTPRRPTGTRSEAGAAPLDFVIVESVMAESVTVAQRFPRSWTRILSLRTDRSCRPSPRLHTWFLCKARTGTMIIPDEKKATESAAGNSIFASPLYAAYNKESNRFDIL